MNLPAACQYKKAFTLTELLIIAGILSLLTALSVPLVVNFYNLRSMDVHKQGIVQSLRRAQFKAMSVEADSAFGVYIGPDRYVLFKGNSYSGREKDYDEISYLPGNLSVTGLSEIIFNKVTGTAISAGTTTLIVNNRSETININEVGRINY